MPREIKFTKAQLKVLNDLLTPPKVESEFNTTARNVLFSIDRNRLPAIKVGRDYLILREHVARLWKARPKKGDKS